jgi:hemerythrin-like domain-containing protein
MDNTLQLIDGLIAEHKTVPEKTRSLEKAANDVRLLSGLKDAGDSIVRGEILQDADLKNLAQIVNILASWLETHFTREETALRQAVISYGNNRFVAALDSLLFEHDELRDRIVHARMHIGELLGGSLDQVRREASIRDLKAHLEHSRKLLETHAAKENHFLAEIRQHLKKTFKQKEKQR